MSHIVLSTRVHRFNKTICVFIHVCDIVRVDRLNCLYCRGVLEIVPGIHRRPHAVIGQNTHTGKYSRLGCEYDGITVGCDDGTIGECFWFIVSNVDIVMCDRDVCVAFWNDETHIPLPKKKLYPANS